jgi:alpha-amylase
MMLGMVSMIYLTWGNSTRKVLFVPGTEHVRSTWLGIKAAQKAGLQVYADVVFNHKLGADDSEEFKATPFNPHNRHEAIGELQEIKAWTHFKFPGRKDKYSKLKWHWWHFNAADFNALDDKTDAIYLLKGKII